MRTPRAVLVVGPLLLSFGATEAICQERVVLRGLPTSVVASGPDTTSRDVLGDSKKQELGLLIVERDGRYFWESRANRELTRIRSGNLVIFLDPRGGGYVTVLNQIGIPDDQRHPNYTRVDVAYSEHVRTHLGSLTYWGEAQRYDP